MTLHHYCVRCGEAFTLAAHDPDADGFRSRMCLPCRAALAAEAEPLPVACLVDADEGAGVEDVAPADLGRRLGIALPDEPDSPQWNDVAADFDGLASASRGELRALLLRAYRAGEEARAEHDREDVRLHEDVVAVLREAGLALPQRHDVEDAIAAYARHCVDEALADAGHRDDVVRAARDDVAVSRESLRILRRWGGTDVLPVPRVDGEIAAIDVRLAQAEGALTEAYHA